MYTFIKIVGLYAYTVYFVLCQFGLVHYSLRNQCVIGIMLMAISYAVLYAIYGKQDDYVLVTFYLIFNGFGMVYNFLWGAIMHPIPGTASADIFFGAAFLNSAALIAASISLNRTRKLEENLKM